MKKAKRKTGARLTKMTKRQHRQTTKLKNNLINQFKVKKLQRRGQNWKKLNKPMILHKNKMKRDGNGKKTNALTMIAL